jgi:hypothetical protein
MSWINFYISFLILANNIVGDSLCKKYCNARFDFCVEYPASFVSMPPPANNDGLTFLSTDKKTKIPAFGSLAVEDFDRIDQESPLQSLTLISLIRKFQKIGLYFRD